MRARAGECPQMKSLLELFSLIIATEKTSAAEIFSLANIARGSHAMFFLNNHSLSLKIGALQKQGPYIKN